jgi:Mn2+/Fe2+ NRAMP family transporter
MFLIDILFAAVIALLLTLIFGLGLGRRGPWSSALIFFLIVFLASWAIGNMVEGSGPEIRGFYWVPFVLGGIIVALLLAAATPLRIYHHRQNIVEREHQEEVREQSDSSTFDAIYDSFFWAFLVVLLILVILGYTSLFYG